MFDEFLVDLSSTILECKYYKGGKRIMIKDDLSSTILECKLKKEVTITHKSFDLSSTILECKYIFKLFY